MEVDRNFGVVDYIIFIGSLVISAAIGLVFAYQDRKEKSVEKYQFGDRRMKTIPVALSLAVSYVSAITFIGFPIETYLYGIIFLWFIVGNAIGSVLAAIYVVPVIYNLKVKSVYEFYEMRFNRTARMICSVVFLIRTVIYMGVAIYLPALALNVVTPLSMVSSILLTVLLCTLYTALGGIKAVVWTDVFQSVIMVGGAVIVLIKASITFGGFSRIMEAADRGGRNNLFDFDFDPRRKTSILAMVLGLACSSLSNAASSQLIVQRFLCCKNVKEAKKSVFLKIPPMAFLWVIACGTGLAMYAFYENCDPHIAGIIQKKDQTMPLLVVQIFKDMPGFAGIFVAAVYSGTLSTISSGVNSVATIIVNDFILTQKPNLSAEKQLRLNKIISFATGVLVALLAFLTSLSTSTAIQIFFRISGSMLGPLLGLHVFATTTPWINAKTATFSLSVGILASCWVSMGAILYGGKSEAGKHLDLSISGCNFTTVDSINITAESVTNVIEQSTLLTTNPIVEQSLIANTLYSLSPYLTSPFGLLVTLITGAWSSFVFGKENPEKADPRFFVPIVTSKRFPPKVLKFFRFGVPEFAPVNDYRSVKTYPGELEMNEIISEKYENNSI